MDVLCGGAEQHVGGGLGRLSDWGAFVWRGGVAPRAKFYEGRATCGRTSVMPMGGFCGGRFCARGAWSALSGVGIAYSDSLV